MKKKKRATSSKPQSQSSQKKSKDKAIAPPSDDYETQNDSGSESDDLPALRKKQKKEKPKERTKGPTYTYTEMYKALDGITWTKTRFADPEILKKLGLFDDVKMILTNMGLKGFLSDAYPVHKLVSCQFLASLDVTFLHDKPTDEDGYGFITFKVGGKTYRMGFMELQSIFGFWDRSETDLPSSTRLPKAMWETIATGLYRTGYIKNTDIRHPAIRYAHKLLGHTFYARRENAKVLEDDLRFLAMGVAQYLQRFVDEKVPIGNYDRTGVVAMFCKQLLLQRQWAMTTSDNTPELRIGGLITPILMARNIDLGEETSEVARLDEALLRKTFYLAGRLGDKFAYTYRDSPLSTANVLLPNENLTMARNRNNLIFLPHSNYHHDSVVEPLEALDFSKRRRAAERSQQSDAPSGSAVNGRPPSPVYGGARYHFQPSNKAIQGLQLREAHSHIRKIQRWNKWQDRNIVKLVESVRSLKKQVKGLTARMGASSPTVLPPQPMADESCTGETNTTSGTAIPQPASTHKQRQHARRHVRAPSPGSSNESLSVSADDSGESPGSTEF